MAGDEGIQRQPSLTPSYIEQGIALGDFRVVGGTQVSGQPFLPPTATNQARLRVSVPAGYTRVAGPHAPGRTG